eukprot:6981812-Heterocapsa_arctica.AAC.1
MPPVDGEERIGHLGAVEDECVVRLQPLAPRLGVFVGVTVCPEERGLIQGTAWDLDSTQSVLVRGEAKAVANDADGGGPQVLQRRNPHCAVHRQGDAGRWPLLP